MARNYLAHLTSPAVLEAQRHYYGAAQPVAADPAEDALTPEEADFIARRDSFYLATSSASGWPYVQHRGGPTGFLRVLDPKRLGFADVRGNRQMLSTGNLATDNRVSLFLMDYVRRERLKILGRARSLDARDDPVLADRLTPVEWKGKAERLVLIDVVSYDWNCPKFITPRYTVAEVEEYAAPLRARIAELERQLGKEARGG